MKKQLTPSPVLTALAQLGLFRSCTPAQLADFLPDTDVIEVAEGTVIDRAGKFARQFVGVIDGFVEAIDTDGRPAVFGPGDHFGATELLEQSAHHATYTAITATTLAVTFGPTFRAVARELPAVVVRSARRAELTVTSELTVVG